MMVPKNYTAPPPQIWLKSGSIWLNLALLSKSSDLLLFPLANERCGAREGSLQTTITTETANNQHFDNTRGFKNQGKPFCVVAMETKPAF